MDEKEKNSQSKLKKSIINDKILLRQASEKEKELSQDRYGTYNQYHEKLSNWYKNIECFLDDIMIGE